MISYTHTFLFHIHFSLFLPCEFNERNMPRIEMLVDSGGYGVSTSDRGSRFNFTMSPPLTIGPTFTSVHISVPTSTIWWTTPNISSGLNDKFYVHGPDINNVQTDFIVTIPQGLYDVDQLEEAILSSLENSGARVTPFALIRLNASNAAGKVQFRFNYPQTSVLFKNDSPWNVLGFSNKIGENLISSVNGITQLAPSVANFNPVDSFLIHSSLVQMGIPVNNIYSSVISQVLITKPPGSQIITESIHPAILPAHELIGTKTSVITMWLTDSKNRPVDTGGEPWSARIVLDII